MSKVAFMLILGVLVTLIVPFDTASAKACVPQSEMEAIAQDFPQFRSLSRGEYCYDSSDTSGLIQGIMFMRETQFSTPMHESVDELFSGKFASSWYEYFTQRIGNISIPRSCPKGVGAYVYGFGDTMYVCPYLLSDVFAPIDRASVFMHEARHIDGYGHITCSRGARAGIRGACDRHIGQGGSYAVSVETFAQLGKYGEGLHPAIVAYAKAAAVIYAEEAFNQPTTVHRSHHFLLMTRDHKLHRLTMDGGASLETLGSTPELGRIVMRGQNMTLMPDNRHEHMRYLFANDEGELSQQAGRTAEEYNALTPAERAEILDIHVGGQWVAKLGSNDVRLACDYRNDDESSHAISGQPVGFIYPNGYSRGAMEGHILMADGSVTEYGCLNARGFVRRSSLRYEAGITRLLKSGQQTMAIKEGGLYQVTATGLKELDMGLQEEIHDLAPNQKFDFYEN